MPTVLGWAGKAAGELGSDGMGCKVVKTILGEQNITKSCILLGRELVVI